MPWGWAQAARLQALLSGDPCGGSSPAGHRQRVLGGTLPPWAGLSLSPALREQSHCWDACFTARELDFPQAMCGEKETHTFLMPYLSKIQNLNFWTLLSQSLVRTWEGAMPPSRRSDSHPHTSSSWGITCSSAAPDTSPKRSKFKQITFPAVQEIMATCKG